jgi:hypothetical protein
MRDFSSHQPAEQKGGTSKERKEMFSLTDICATQALRNGDSGRSRTRSRRIWSRRGT